MITLNLILSLSKDEAKISCFFSILLVLLRRIRLLKDQVVALAHHS